MGPDRQRRDGLTRLPRRRFCLSARRRSCIVCLSGPVRRPFRQDAAMDGGMAEWTKAPVLKTGDGKPSGGSNPSPSVFPPGREKRRQSPGQGPRGECPGPKGEVWIQGQMSVSAPSQDKADEVFDCLRFDRSGEEIQLNYKPLYTTETSEQYGCGGCAVRKGYHARISTMIYVPFKSNLCLTQRFDKRQHFEIGS